MFRFKYMPYMYTAPVESLENEDLILWELYFIFCNINWLKCSKEQQLFEMESFWNIMHVFAVTFVQLVIRYVSWAAYRHIRIISEESCDAED